MTIVVNPIRIPTFAPITAFCYLGSAPTLPPTDSNGLLGTWQPATVSNTTSGNYVFTPTIGQCTHTNFTMPISVFDDFDFEFKQACVGDDFVLQVVPLANSFDLNQVNFSWKNSSNLIVGNNSSTFNVTNYFSSNSILPQFPLSFTVDVTDANGCTKSHDVPLTSIYCSIQKGISPNDDDKNEFFDLQLLDVKKLEIFNRYGTKVYSKANYLNEWVGQSDDGGTLPDGVYYYVIEFNGDRSTKVGWIYLTR
ncbi:MAG: gliding motility-associated C-terminal domain-containing protein [Flavobacterium sp.]|nr:gliding motility-associated C-terminal domain-containing protein [Flavobacterium sp.]